MRLRAWLLDRGLLLALGVLALYAWLAPAHVVDGDNAEFATLGALGGAAHPPGYPLYVLWLRALAWLPGESPAHTAALATALLGAASIAILHAACRAWGARPLAATLACALFAGAPIVMTMYSEAEVFALNGVIVGALLWLAAERGPVRGVRRALALGLVAGLGLANHHTCVLVAPVGILGLVRAVRESRWSALPIAAAGLAVGLVPYAYLLVAPSHPGSWGQVDGLGDVVAMFLRRDYGGPSTFATAGDAVPAAASLAALADTVGRTWLWLPALVGLASAVQRGVRRADGKEPRAGWWALLASLALAGPVLVMQFNIAPEGVGRYVVDRFHLLPALLLAIPVADAIDRLAPVAARSLPRAPAALGHALALGVLAAVAGTALPHVARVHAPAVEEQARGVLRALPADAIVFGFDDDLALGIDYVQLALGERRDVAYAHVPMFGRGWYRARAASRGLQIGDRYIDRALATGRPVFVQPFARDVVAAFPHYRVGILVRLLPRGTAVPPLDDVIAANKAWLASLELDYDRPGPDDEWPTAIHRRYARTWRELAAELAAAGRRDDAEWASEVAREIGPRP
ncbi:MAG TPA: DUF2723 domain-containing protein [Kofleriaceae bacterium]|nr:DUF2723 domain-containing protein [Kofleriaceae bacterium]